MDTTDILGLLMIGFFFYIGWLPIAIPMAILYGLTHII